MGAYRAGTYTQQYGARLCLDGVRMVPWKILLGVWRELGMPGGSLPAWRELDALTP